MTLGWLLLVATPPTYAHRCEHLFIQQLSALPLEIYQSPSLSIPTIMKMGRTEIFRSPHSLSVNEFFDAPLSDTKDPGLANLLRRWFKSDAMVAFFGKRLFYESNRISLNHSKSPFETLVSHFKIGKRYTFVLTDKHIVISETSENKVVGLLAKHIYLANFKEVYFAGEIWISDSNVFHFSNASGSFQPPNARIDSARAFFEKLFGQSSLHHWEIVGHRYDEEN